jgi:hypothetical protein
MAEKTDDRKYLCSFCYDTGTYGEQHEVIAKSAQLAAKSLYNTFNMFDEHKIRVVSESRIISWFFKVNKIITIDQCDP